MSSLLTPDFGLLFWMVISFTVVFVLLARFGFPVITRAVNKRSEYIRDSLDAADQANRRLASVHIEADEVRNQAMQQQAEIIRKAAADSDTIMRSAQDRAAVESEKQMAATRERIALQKEKAMAQINAQVAEMAIDIAERVLRAQLEDPQKQHALILRMLDEAESLGAEDNNNR